MIRSIIPSEILGEILARIPMRTWVNSIIRFISRRIKINRLTRFEGENVLKEIRREEDSKKGKEKKERWFQFLQRRLPTTRERIIDGEGICAARRNRVVVLC